ncbi:hypothetical protein ACIRYZ_41460 [Kitasatospora sp. NPDC101155]|uniref:hypothetical protein n=1 Tax=Kitasatospora sp. NPDC101155 TaxID=3364097 RepID=UPI003817DD31
MRVSTGRRAQRGGHRPMARRAGRGFGPGAPALGHADLTGGQPACQPCASTVGTLPNGWSYQTFWQFADSGTFPGDQDLFNGASDRLSALALG